MLASAWCLWAYALGLLVGGAGPTGSAAGAVLAAAGLLVVAACVRLGAVRPGVAGHPVGPLATWRQRARLPRLPRLRDPDAAGRARPRAPSARPSAA